MQSQTFASNPSQRVRPSLSSYLNEADYRRLTRTYRGIFGTDDIRSYPIRFKTKLLEVVAAVTGLVESLNMTIVSRWSSRNGRIIQYLAIRVLSTFHGCWQMVFPKLCTTPSRAEAHQLPRGYCIDIKASKGQPRARSASATPPSALYNAGGCGHWLSFAMSGAKRLINIPRITLSHRHSTRLLIWSRPFLRYFAKAIRTSDTSSLTAEARSIAVMEFLNRGKSPRFDRSDPGLERCSSLSPRRNPYASSRSG